MELEWNHNKRLKNLALHRLDFQDVTQFDWSSALYFGDSRRDYGEDRVLATGFFRARLTVLIYTQRRNRIRIISWRRPNGRELRYYENAHRS